MITKKNSVFILLLTIMLSCFVGMSVLQAIPSNAETGEGQATIDVFDTSGAVVEGGNFVWADVAGFIVDEAPAASSGKSIQAYTSWGNCINLTTPIDISAFINPAISVWIYIDDTNYVSTEGTGFCFELADYKYSHIPLENCIDGWNKVILPLDLTSVTKINMSVSAAGGYTYSPEKVMYHNIQIVDYEGTSTGVVATEAKYTAERQEPIDVFDMQGNMLPGASFEWPFSMECEAVKDNFAPSVSEGKSLQSYTTWGSCIKLNKPINIASFVDPAISAWVYIDDTDYVKTTGTGFCFELADYKYTYIPLENCIDGWNKVILPLDLTSVTKISMAVSAAEGYEYTVDKILFHNIQIIDYDGTSTGVVATEAKQVAELQETITVFGTDGALINGAAWEWSYEMNENSIQEKAPAASSGKSVQMYTSWGNCIKLETPIDISDFISPAISVWVYIDDTDYIAVPGNPGFCFQLDETFVYYHIPLENCIDGWNKVILPLDLTSVTKINMAVSAAEGYTYSPEKVMYHNIQIVDYEGTSTGIVATEAKPEVVKADPIVLYSAEGNLANGASWSWSSYMDANSIQDFAPSVSSGKSIQAYTAWGNSIALETPVDISAFINPAISVWIYIENLDYVDQENPEKRFAIETVDYVYNFIPLADCVRGWNQVVIPISGTAVNKLQMHVFASELFGYQKDYVWYHDIQIVDAEDTGVVATEAATTAPKPTPVPAEDFILMDKNAELVAGAAFGWEYLDDNGLVPVDVSPNNDGYSMRLVTGQPGLLINFPVSLLPDYQIGAAAQFWFYVPDPSVLTGNIKVEAKTYVYNIVNISNAVAGWNKVSVPIQAFEDGVDVLSSAFNIVFEVEPEYIAASILIHDIRIVDSSKSGILETKLLPDSAAFDSATIALTADNNSCDIPSITTSPEDVKLLWYYFSDDTDVVRIENGKLVAYANGSATIIAKIGSLTATLTVTVTGFKTCDSIVINNGDIEITEGMEDIYLDITVKDEAGNEFTQYVAKFSSSDNLIAAIDEDGKLIPLNNGSCEITVTVGTVSESITVTVTDIEGGISLINKEGLVQLGGSYGWEGTYPGGGASKIVPFGESGKGRCFNEAGLDITGFNLNIAGLPKENMMWDFWLFIPEGLGAFEQIKIDVMGGKKYYLIEYADLAVGYNHIQIPLALDNLNAIGRISFFLETPQNQEKRLETVMYNLKLVAVETPAFGIVEQQLIPTSITVSENFVNVSKEYNYVDIPQITFNSENAKANVVFASSNEYIADVVNGKIVGFSNGTVTITVSLAMDEEVYTFFSVTVSGFPDITSLIVTGGNEFTIVPMERLELEVKPDKDGATYVLSYSSSDPSVALVSSNGIITGVGEGTCTITVKLEGTNISTSVSLTVQEKKEENSKKSGCGSSANASSAISFMILAVCALAAIKKKAR